MATYPAPPRQRPVKPEGSTRTYVFNYPRHLDTAQMVTKLDFYREHPDRALIDYPEIPLSAWRDVRNGFDHGENILHTIEDYIKSRSFSENYKATADLHKSLNLAHESLTTQADVLYGEIETFSSMRFTEMKNLVMNSKKVQTSLNPKVQVLNIHEELQVEAMRGDWYFTLPSLPEVSFHGDIVVMHTFKAGPLVITYPMLLGVLDRLEATFHFWLYVAAVQNTPRYLNKDYAFIASTLHEILEDAHKELGTEASYLYKAMEAICTGCILFYMDEDDNDKDFLERTMEEMVRKRPKVARHAFNVIRLFRMFLDKNMEDYADIIMDCYGQEKLHFFPLVNGEDGLRKMHRYAISIRPSDANVEYELRGMLMREFTIGYYSQEKTLPKIHLMATYDERLLAMWRSGKLKSAKFCRIIPLSAWAELIPVKMFDFNYTDDILDMIDDKACAPNRSDLHQIYHPSVRAAYNMPAPRERSTRRLIEWVLEQEVVDIKKLFEMVENRGKIPWEWSIILLSIKERENKPDGRPFSTLHPCIRMLCSSLEKNISESIFKYFPQQTMTSTGSQVTSSVDQVAARKSGDDFSEVKFHIDIEQWNFTFRERVTNQCSAWMNSVFGVEHFSILMSIFKDSLFVLNDQFVPYCDRTKFVGWDGQCGGNQGIAQKFWTLMTLLTILMAVSWRNWKYILLGSGDNQVLALSIPARINVSEITREVKQDLSEAFRKIGLIVKVEETWHSSRMVAYQRKYYLDGVPLAQGCKTCLRFAAGDNEGSNSVTMMTLTAVSAGASLSSGLSDPAIGPFLALVEWYLNLFTHSVWSKHIPSGHDELICMSWLNSSLGHLPFQPLSFFQYAGHRDLLTETLAMLQKIMNRYPKYREVIGSALNMTWREPDEESNLALVLDPYSPNIVSATTAEAHIREEVIKFLSQKADVKNKRIKGVFQYLEKRPQVTMANSLLKIRPLNLSIIHALFDYSPLGHVLSVTNRFVKVKTVVRITDANRLQENVPTFSQVIRTKDVYLLKTISGTFERGALSLTSVPQAMLGKRWNRYLEWCQIHTQDPTCTFSARLYLMVGSHGLGKEFIFGPYTPAPSEQIRFHPDIESAPLDKCIMVSPAWTIPDTKVLMETTRGPFSLYIGSHTNEPIAKLRHVNLSGVQTGTAITMLSKIYAWMNKTGANEDMMSFLKKEIDSRMEGLSDLIAQLDPKAGGGHILHRLHLPGINTGAFHNTRSHLSTWYCASTNEAVFLQASPEDRYVFFQQLLHHIFATLRWCDPVKKRMAFEVLTDHCGYIIPELSYSAPPNLRLPAVADHGIAILSDEVASKIKEGLLHKVWVRDLHMAEPPTAVHGLAAAVGSKVADALMLYQLGKADTEITGAANSPSGPNLSITILRMIDTELLLQSMALAMAFRGSLGKMMGPQPLLERLRLIASTPTTLADSSAFEPILRALLTAGKLSDLVVLANTGVLWSDREVSHSMQLVFFKAMINCVTDMLNGHPIVGLCVEVTQNYKALSYLKRFLKAWLYHFRKWAKIHPDRNVLEFLRSSYAQNSWIKPLICVSAEELIEDSRNSVAEIENAQPIPARTLKTLQKPWDVSKDMIRPWAKLSGNDVDTPDDETLRLKNNYLQERKGIKVPPNAFQINRWRVHSSGGCIKLAEVMAHTGMTWPTHPNFVSLAEGAGSMLAFLLHIYPEAKALYNSLVTAEDIGPAGIGHFIPPELDCPCGVKERVKNFPYLEPYFGDLNRDETWDKLENQVDKYDLKDLVVTMDMEFRPDNTDVIWQYLYNFCKNVRPQWVMVKLFVTEKLQEHQALFRAMAELFPMCEACKPSTSNPTSDEVYVVWGYGPGGFISSEWRRLISWASRVLQLTDLITEKEYFLKIQSIDEWAQQFHNCMQKDQFTLEPFESGKGGLEAGLVLATKQLRQLIGAHDNTESGVSRLIMHMVNSEDKGTLATWNAIWSIVSVYAVLDDMLGFIPPGEPQGVIWTLLERRDKGLLCELARVEKELPLQPQRDKLWRMMGQVLCDSITIPPPDAKYLIFQYIHVVDKIKGRHHIQEGLKRLPESAMKVWTAQKMKADQKDMGLFSERGGMKWAADELRNLAISHGEFYNIRRILPTWLDKIWDSFNWPVSQADFGEWDLIVCPRDLIQRVEFGLLNSAVLFTWRSPNEGGLRSSEWELETFLVTEDVIYERYSKIVK